MGEFLGRGQMQVGEDDLAFPDQAVFLGKGLLDMHDHVGFLIDFRSGRDDLRPGPGVGVVLEPAAPAGLRLDQDRMPFGLHDLHPGGGHADTVFLGFDFLENSDDHDALLSFVGPDHPAGPSRAFFMLQERDRAQPACGMKNRPGMARRSCAPGRNNDQGPFVQ